MLFKYLLLSEAILRNIFVSVAGIPLELTAMYAILFILVDMEMLGYIFCSFLLNSYVTLGGSVNGFVFCFF